MSQNNLIFTTDSCVGCNKCIKGCPAIGANTIVDIEEGSRISVDGTKCIHCGSCLKNCTHDARRFTDDFDILLKDLDMGKPIILMIAPSFFATYSNEYPQMLAFLRDMGFRAIYDVSLGANITTWAYIKYMKKTGRNGLISSACPVVVDYIQKYKPSLIDYLMPVMSPAGCLMTYLKENVYNNTHSSEYKYAFLCPCIGKHDEYTSYPNGSKIDYTFTFKTFYSYIKDNNLFDQEEVDTSKCDELRIPGVGQLYPVPGGLRSNISAILSGNHYIRQMEGPSRIYKFLDVYDTMVENGDTLPYIIDILNCEGGCNEGVASSSTEEETEIVMTTMQAHSRSLLRSNSESSLINGTTPDERWESLDKYMTSNLHLSLDTFIRSYDKGAAVVEPDIPESAIEKIFVQMNKFSDYDRTINCTSCGYKGCYQMARAIFCGYNTPENCVHYVKNTLIASKIEIEKMLSSLLGTTSNMDIGNIKTDDIVRQLGDAMNEVEKQREELNNNVAAKSQMFANLTHELRTPLNAILNMADLIDTSNLSKEQLVNITSIKTAGNSLMDTINEILDMSKLEAGKFTIVEDQYYLHNLLGEVITVMNFRCLEKKLEFVRNLDPSSPDILIGDFKRIRQVMINLIGNAIKYTDKGSITISAGWNKDHDNPVMIFSVSDTGIGIRQEDIPFLFDSYKQVNESETKHIQGTGLGLAISKSIVDEMNGEITVESTYGVGTTFKLTIPQVIPQYIPIGDTMKHISNVPVQNPAEAEKKDFFAPSYKVLVVDDMPVNLRIAQALLDKFQIYSDTVSSGKEAVLKCARTKYDIIFMDQQMPEMSGFETVNSIRRECLINQKTPIVFMSANDKHTFESEMASDITYEGYVEKPIKLDALKSTLLTIIDSSAVIFDKEGFIPDTAELEASVAEKDYNKYLVLMAALERYSKVHNSEQSYRLACKYRKMLQSGITNIPVKNFSSIKAVCNSLRSKS